MDKARLFSLFGGKLKALRLAKGLSISQLSDLTKIDAEVLEEYENGELEPGLSAIMIIANALKISHLELLDIKV